MMMKPAGAPARSESGSGSAGAVARKNMRVLLVEDDAPTRVLVAALLKKCGYAVAEAANGKAALELVDAAEAKFDLVLTDMMMPEVGGVELMTSLMQHENTKETPCVMMSTVDSRDAVMECIGAGAKEFLVKPVRQNELQNLWRHTKTFDAHRASGASSAAAARHAADPAECSPATAPEEGEAGPATKPSTPPEEDEAAAAAALGAAAEAAVAKASSRGQLRVEVQLVKGSTDAGVHILELSMTSCEPVRGGLRRSASRSAFSAFQAPIDTPAAKRAKKGEKEDAPARPLRSARAAAASAREAVAAAVGAPRSRGTITPHPPTPPHNDVLPQPLPPHEMPGPLASPPAAPAQPPEFVQLFHSALQQAVEQQQQVTLRLNDAGTTTAERRAEAIRRFMQKRKERNFKKKVRYASRKRLAESRPRVRGQFVRLADLEKHAEQEAEAAEATAAS